MVRKKITDLLSSELANLQSFVDQMPQISPIEMIVVEEIEATNSQSSKQTNSQTPEVANLLPSEQSDFEASKSNAIEPSVKSDKVANLQSPRVTNIQILEQPDSETSELPKYLRLERKEVRLRIDQLDALTSLIRQLNRARRGKGERLTENTLIRVAINLLLENADQLQGITEDELLASLGLPSSNKH